MSLLIVYLIIVDLNSAVSRYLSCFNNIPLYVAAYFVIVSINFTIMTEDWTYYFYISLTLLPVYFAFKLIQWMSWELFVNN